MSPRFRPVGKTFKERWPQEAEETRYLAATSYAVVLGGVLGVLTVPLLIWGALATAPILIGAVVAVLVAIPLMMSRATGAAPRWLALAWKIAAWVAGAAVLGMLVETLVLAMCDEACRAALAPGSGPSGMLLTYALLVVGSVALAIGADRGGNALRRRAGRAAARS